MENLEDCLENNTNEYVYFQLDTGASCNVIGIEDLSEILNNANLHLEPTNIILKVFRDGTVEPIGTERIQNDRENKIL